MNGVRFLLVVLWIAAAGAPRAAEQRPNVLFIMVDEMKWNVMSCAGHDIARTPNLDRLAREGTRFSAAFTVAPICTPSRYSFFSSRYAHVHGATSNGMQPAEAQILLPDILRHAGYQTAISGKLHFNPVGPDYGFEFFWSFQGEGPHKLPTWPEFLAQKHGIASTRRPENRPFPDDPLGADLGKLSYPKEDAQTFWITDRAIDFLRQRDPARPFFLFVSYLDPHSPSHLCEPYWSMFDPEKMPLPPTFRADPAKSATSAANRHEVNDPKIVKAMTAAYYAKVTMVDDNVGRLLGQLKALGLDDRTMVVFTADHGNMLGDLNRWFKGAMYEGSTRIPLLMKAPAAGAYAAHFNRGAVVSNLVESIDVMPTLCEIAGMPLPAAGIQGRSLTKLVAGGDAGWKDCAYAERNSMMVRTPRYKLIVDPRGRGTRELYDLTTDPGETRDLAGDAAHADVLRDLSARLEAWQKDRPPIPVIEGVAPVGGGAGAAPAEPERGGKKRRQGRSP